MKSILMLIQVDFLFASGAALTIRKFFPFPLCELFTKHLSNSNMTIYVFNHQKRKFHVPELSKAKGLIMVFFSVLCIHN